MDTETIGKMLESPAWWFSVVVVGLVLAILAAFIVDALKYIYSNVQDRLATSLARRRYHYKKHIVILSRNPELLKIELSLAIANMVKPLFMVVVITCMFGFLLFRHSYPDSVLGLFQTSQEANVLNQKLLNVIGSAAFIIEVIAFMFASVECTKISIAYTYMLKRPSMGKRVHGFTSD